MPSGRLVLLNGPSSAGKTTLAKAVVGRLRTPWLLLPIDLFHQIRTRPDADLTDRQWHDVFRRTRAAYHRALVGAVACGCDVLGDHVLSEPWRLDDLLRLSVGLDVLLVHVTCDPAELRRREKARGDRDPGTARDPAAAGLRPRRLRPHRRHHPRPRRADRRRARADPPATGRPRLRPAPGAAPPCVSRRPASPRSRSWRPYAAHWDAAARPGRAPARRLRRAPLGGVRRRGAAALRHPRPARRRGARRADLEAAYAGRGAPARRGARVRARLPPHRRGHPDHALRRRRPQLYAVARRRDRRRPSTRSGRRPRSPGSTRPRRRPAIPRWRPLVGPDFADTTAALTRTRRGARARTPTPRATPYAVTWTTSRAGRRATTTWRESARRPHLGRHPRRARQPQPAASPPTAGSSSTGSR